MERLSAPLSVNLWVTGKCNLDCAYCYAHPFDSGHIPTEVLVDLFRSLESMKVFEIHMGGGEPFLHPEIFEILDAIFAFKRHVVLLTNGTLLSSDKCEQLRTYLDHGRFTNLQISLDSHQPEVNDRVRGGTLQTIEAIECLADLELDPQIAVVVHRVNIGVALDVIDYFYPRIKRYHYMNLMPSRRLVEREYRHDEDLNPDPIERDDFWKKLAEKVEKMPSDISVSGAHRKEYLEVPPTWHWPGCLAGVTRCEIKSNLDVVACNIAGNAILGNIKEESFSEVWMSKRAQRIAEIPYPLCSSEGRNMTEEYVGVPT